MFAPFQKRGSALAFAPGLQSGTREAGPKAVPLHSHVDAPGKVSVAPLEQPPEPAVIPDGIEVVVSLRSLRELQIEVDGSP